jgi:Tellurite resistance protein
MPMEWLRTNVEAARKRVADEVSKFKNRDFMEGTIAAIALVSAADGDISSAEKQKLIGYFGASEELKAFKTDDVIAYFKSVTDKFDFDAAIGKAEALRVVGKLRSNQDAARLLVRVCCVVGAADGNFDENEKAVVVQICRELGLNPADFDL